ncbi:hypothetical protein LKO27_03770 [Tessaracoccus sp. OS52]|uniref:hypothetical protein n=1 Tax=Tessaracoccus sp. OS52 TaxID=2886691 RepID=UPI001D1292D3|nr:hypothetical protein [Tessaracoccus sp. OS52]MCC2592537.1 hypothetical protein [Tessaracoccus sp. OS52]
MSAIGVMGVGGGVGATVTALAVAEVTRAARLVELCPPWASGLADATTAELGLEEGWRLGKRGDLLVERLHDPAAAMRDLPGLAVVDAGAWDGSPPAAIDQFSNLVVVARHNIPSLRRLSNVLESLPDLSAVCAVVGAPTRGWPRPVMARIGPLLRSALADGLVHALPEYPVLRRAGITGQPLPKSLLAATTRLVKDLEVDPPC